MSLHEVGIYGCPSSARKLRPLNPLPSTVTTFNLCNQNHAPQHVLSLLT